jgi:opacity protein-like surface antigen
MSLAVIAMPASLSAQSLGIGPKLSLVRSDAPASPASRLFGGTLRIMSSKHLGLEGTLDYRAEYNADRTARLRETPFQASLLLFPVRGALSPYLLGGFGVYTRHADTLAATGAVIDTAKERKTGWHLGLGAEIFLVRRAAVFVDYRWRFVKFGQPDEGGEPIDVPGLDRLSLSHRGSMWNGGLAFYF